MNLPTLGVGITYIPELDPLLKSNPHIVNLLEVEPQTHWYHEKSSGSYIINQRAIKNIKSYNYPKILHSVSSPVGSTTGPDPMQIPYLLKMISYLGAHWISEHISFNRIKYNQSDFRTGFLLPPLQTSSGISAVVNAVNAMANQMRIPFCIENGTNYLRPRDGELTDGQFISEITEATHCGLILDLHNAYTNELNGRQTVNDFLGTIPLEYVWELHLAGGYEDDDYWLDSHGSTIPKPLIDIAYSLVPKLANLRAIVFEIEPSHLSSIGLETIYSELKRLHKIWDSRRPSISNSDKKSVLKNRVNHGTNNIINLSPIEWEYTLGSLVVGHGIENALATEIKSDRGLEVMRKIIASFRSSMVVSVLKLTSRLLMLTLGIEQFKKLLSDYWKESTPELFANSESEGFAKYLEDKHMDILYLYDILKLEISILNVMVYGKTQKVQFQYDPRPIINSLMERKLPDSSLSPEIHEIEIGYDKITVLK